MLEILLGALSAAMLTALLVERYQSKAEMEKLRRQWDYSKRDLVSVRHELTVQFGEAKYWMARAQGESEKAQQAVNFLDHGRVDRKPAKTIDTDGFEGRVDQDARNVEAAISEESIERGIDALGEQYEAEGFARPPAAELRREVEQLFNASSNAEGQIE